MKTLANVAFDPFCSIYRLDASGSANVDRFIASTPETRAIANDPRIRGLQYTSLLEGACSRTLESLSRISELRATEDTATVLHILRGGLNFGLREALGRAFRWNNHRSAFLSAQRVKTDSQESSWEIREDSYEKIFLPSTADVVCGDVVATGTSLFHAMKRLANRAEETSHQIRSILFFTFGSELAENTLSEGAELCRAMFPAFEGASLVYFEGRFEVAQDNTPLSIKIPDTDLLRRDSVLAPEFQNSQYDSPSFPLERCAIYDAGSRAFHIPEYVEDVQSYWQQTLRLADDGMTFGELLQERFPDLERDRFSEVDLRELCLKSIERLDRA